MEDLRTIITSLALTHSPTQLHLYLIDFGGQALRIFEKLPHVGGTFGEGDVEGKMAPIVLVIDDYDMLNILAQNPLTDLKEFLLRARDLRFHIIVAGSPNDLARPDALLQQVRSCRIGIILGGDPTDMPLLGVRMSDFPPGRGQFVRRNRRYLIQVAHAEAKEIIFHVTTEALVR